MKELSDKTSLSKSPSQIVLEYIILAVCLCVIALRATFTEGPVSRSNISAISTGDSAYGLLLSVVLISIFIIWLLWGLCSRRFLYRYTAAEIGLIIFIVASFISGFKAADKRLALNNILNLTAPCFMAVVLVQLLDSEAKIKIVLIAIVSVGVVSAYQGIEQFFWTRPMLIQQYERNPESLLRVLGIEWGSFRQMLFERRLYSRGVSSFFTTGNSAGSFSLLIIFVILALLSGEFVNRKFNESAPARLCADCLVLAVVLVGLFLTFSKGSILAAAVAGVSFAGYVFFGDWLSRHKKAFLLVIVLIVLATTVCLVSYGVKNNQVPGGNSIVVRGQYWKGAAKMYAENPYVGVGPGNFVHFYPRYKSASAFETVAEPHNFILSILTQYGPLGLSGFLALVFVPLFTVVFSRNEGPLAHSSSRNLSSRGFRDTSKEKPQKPEFSFTILSIIFIVVISASLLIVRPMIMSLPYTISESERLAAEVLLFLMPVFVFIVSFVFMSWARKKPGTLNNRFVIAALFFGLGGFLLHNLIDFAIFEPGVSTTFWALMACLIAMHLQRNPQPYLSAGLRFSAKLFAVLAGVIFVWCFLISYAWMPVFISTDKIQKARGFAAFQHFESAHKLLKDAEGRDKINPELPSFTGRFCLRQSRQNNGGKQEWLKQAERSFLEAIERNTADYKNYENLIDTYNLLADFSDKKKEKQYLEKAFAKAVKAVEIYPNCGRLQFKLAQNALKLGNKELALEHYERAVRIEDDYRRGFRKMYPDREIVSRLGEQRYQQAKQRIEDLSKESSNQG